MGLDRLLRHLDRLMASKGLTREEAVEVAKKEQDYEQYFMPAMTARQLKE